MEEQEKFDIINRISNSRPTNWKWRTDQKKFGWGSGIKQNRGCKVFGQGKEYRKAERKFIALVRHKMLKHIPLTTEEIESSKHYWEISKEVEWHVKNIMP